VLVVEIHLLTEVQREPRVEAITAKIHGSELSLNSDGSYLWGNNATVRINWNGSKTCDLKLRPVNGVIALMSELRLQELVASLFQLNIISFGSQRSGKRRI
jgi:hypothetical protein